MHLHAVFAPALHLGVAQVGAIDVQMLDSDLSVVRWSPDGKRLVAGEKQGRLTVLELVAR